MIVTNQAASKTILLKVLLRNVLIDVQTCASNLLPKLMECGVSSRQGLSARHRPIGHQSK